MPTLNLETRLRHTAARIITMADELHRQNAPRITWADDIVAVLRELGGSGGIATIDPAVKRRRLARRVSWPTSHEQTISRTLQSHCSESPMYKGAEDLFRRVPGQRGQWKLLRR